MTTSTSPANNAPDIVLLHGANGCKAEMQPWCEALNSLGFRSHAISLAGHGGRAIPPALTMSEFTQDALTQLDQMGLRTPVIVLGYSFGGLIALNLARNHPERVRGIVSLATKYVFDSATIGHFTHLLQVPRLIGLPHRREHLTKVHYPNDWRKLVEALHGFFSALAIQPPLSDADLRAIHCPTLVLSGARDQLVSAAETQALARSLRRARLAMFDGIAHPVTAIPVAGLAKAIGMWSEREGILPHAG